MPAMPSYPCPECGNEVPTTGMSSKVGEADPARSHRDCPHCKVPLVRSTEGRDRGWQVDRDRLPADSDLGGGD